MKGEVNQDASADDKEIFNKMFESENELKELMKKLQKKKELVELMTSGRQIGYGDWRNVSRYSFLHECLNEERRVEYEKKLEKEDPVKYREYKIWEDAYEEINNLKEKKGQ